MARSEIGSLGVLAIRDFRILFLGTLAAFTAAQSTINDSLITPSLRHSASETIRHGAFLTIVPVPDFRFGFADERDEMDWIL